MISRRRFGPLVLLVSKPHGCLKGTYVEKYLRYGETHAFASKKSKAVPVPKRSIVPRAILGMI